jgi:hypothetical protein
MTAVRHGPAHAAPDSPAGLPTSAVNSALTSAPTSVSGPSTGRHARVGTGVPSGPLVRLRTVVPAPEPGGRLVIDSSYCRLSPHLGARKVAVSVDGLPWRFAWGRTPIDLPAGRHLVEIEVEGGRKGWGHVADAVPVAAGNTVEVFYRAPALPRLPGSLGPSRQRTAGLPVCAALLALGGLAVLALLVAALVLLVA